MSSGSIPPTRGTRSPNRRGPWGLHPVLVLTLMTAGMAAAAEVVPTVLGAFDFSEDGGKQEKLPRALEEVSGLTVTPLGRVLAHNDERAVIYELDPQTWNVAKVFSAGIGGVRGDFEGIASVEDRLFLMTSSGDLLETAEGEDGSVMQYRIHRMGLQRLCEFEGLAFDPPANSLLLPCKRTKTNELKGHLVVFAVELDSMRPYPVPHLFIPFGTLEDGEVGGSFHPSGIEVHLETGRRILISAQEETILEISPGGIFLGGRKLHKKTHPQPEGITFLADGSLLLADEGQGKRGRLTRYEVRPDDGEGAS